MFSAIYNYFAEAETGSVANHLSHCILSALITFAVVLFLTYPEGLMTATLVGCFTGAGVFAGRAQAQTEVRIAPMPWWVSWLIKTWAPDQVWGAVFPIISSIIIYGVMFGLVHYRIV